MNRGASGERGRILIESETLSEPMSHTKRNGPRAAAPERGDGRRLVRRQVAVCHGGWRAALRVLASLCLAFEVGAATPTFTVQPVDNTGFDVFADGQRVAPIRWAVGGAIVADNIETNATGLRFSSLRSRDPLAVTFAPDDYVGVTIPSAGVGGDTNAPAAPEPVVRFRLTLSTFDVTRWQAMFPEGKAPFHFLVCPMSTAQVWHQRGWLNATPNADRFPLLEDVHVGSPEISCLWNRNWSYLCPLGGHPIPMIGVWDPPGRLYVGYDFQGARSTDQSERYVATAYCWEQGAVRSFITLVFPHGGLRYGELVYPHGGEVIESWFHLVVDTDLPSTEDPNERFQARLFDRYTNSLPLVPAGNDLAFLPGSARRRDFAGPIGLDLWGPGGETTFYPAGTVLVHGWTGHREMPIDTAVRRGDLTSVTNARVRLEALLTNYAQVFTVGGDRCLFWNKPLAGAWHPDWGGAPVTTVHNADGWFPARVLVGLYRYDRSRGQARTNYLEAIDGLFHWAKHFVWTRNEFADVPSSPFAIGGTLSAAFLLDYYFTFRFDADAVRRTNAELALRLARNVTWRYLQVWAMDSDRFDGALDSAFLLEPNSGRDWAGLACANEVAWNLDTLTQVYVHTGDPRMRYYLRGILQRWPALYRPVYEDSLADCGSDSLTEGLGLFDGAGPGRGNRYAYGFTESLPFNEPVGDSILRVVAGVQACIAFEKHGSGTDVTDYRTTGNGSCAFRIVSPRTNAFDLSFSYPYVDVSRLSVSVVRDGQTNVLGASQITRPTQSPSSLYLRQLHHDDVVAIGQLPADAPVLAIETPRLYDESTVAAQNHGSFATLPLAGNVPLVQDWNDVHSFAGIIPGERWVYGIPYEQRTRAVTNVVAIAAPEARLLVLAYAPPEDQVLERSPGLVLDDGSNLVLSGKPALAWRGWPPIFTRVVLVDYAVLPSGRSVRQADPRGTLLMAATAFHGELADWQPVQTALATAAEELAQAEAQRLALLALQASYAQLPTGRIALLPPTTAGATATFAALTGLRKLWIPLSEQQLVDPAAFNAVRYPLAFYLGSERYVKTVQTTGDGKQAIARYLSEGGTLVLLASGPFPMFYGDGPGGFQGPADALLPPLGLPIQITFEQAPAGLRLQQYPTQSVLPSVPTSFAFPAGDPRLRSINRSALNSAHRYTPILRVSGAQGQDYGDAAGYLEFRTGSARGGKVLYIWSTLLASPEGQTIQADAVSWLLNGILRAPQIDAILSPEPGLAVLQFDALPSVNYLAESSDTLTAGSWSSLQDFLRAPTNREVRFTNTSPRSSRFYRLLVRP